MSGPPRERLRPVFGEALFGLLGPLVWVAHFGAIYLGHHLACETGVPGGRAFDAFVLAVTAAAVVVLAFAALAPRAVRRMLHLDDSNAQVDRFIVAAMRLLSLLSLVGVLWAGTAVLYVAACAA